MKYTLKALLTTTLLTVPTAFGSAAHPDEGGRLEAVHASAVVVAATARPALTVDRLPIDIGLVAGCRTREGFIVGFLVAKDVSNLSRVSRRFNAQVQPVLDQAKAWQRTNVILKLLQSAPIDPEDQKKINFLGTSTNPSFDDVLNKLLAIKREVVEDRAKDIRHKVLGDAIASNESFDSTQKLILKGLLPNATSREIREAARIYANSLYKTSNIVDALYKEFAEHKDTTYHDIQEAECELPDWVLRSEKFFHLLIMITGKYKRNPIQYTLISALGYIVRQYPDYQKAAILFELAGSQDDIKEYLAKNAVDGLRELGDRCLTESDRAHYYARSDALLERIKSRFPGYNL
jgi:hypothetical protein